MVGRRGREHELIRNDAVESNVPRIIGSWFDNFKIISRRRSLKCSTVASYETNLRICYSGTDSTFQSDWGDTRWKERRRGTVFALLRMPAKTMVGWEHSGFQSPSAERKKSAMLYNSYDSNKP
eukprot:scaffold991_cov128-Cylindrotheca_fusiformis.AAC.22